MGKQKSSSMPAIAGGFFLPAQRSVHSKGGFYGSPSMNAPKTNPKSIRSLKKSGGKNIPLKPTRRDEVSISKMLSTPRVLFPTDKTISDKSLNMRLKCALEDLNEIKSQYSGNQELNSHSSTTIESCGKTVCKERIDAKKEMDSKDSLDSPTHRLKISEIVMRKLYKKNLQLEKDLTDANNTISSLKKKLDVENPQTQTPETAIPILNCPPTAESVSKIEEQKENYLRFLAEEQDRTIADLRKQNQKLQDKLMSSPDLKATRTPNQTVPKLQKKLKIALEESSRQKNNYSKMKNDYKKLLLLRTRAISNNLETDSSAKQLVHLMEQRLEREEAERQRESNNFNVKLYEIEQKSCDWFVEKKLIEKELTRVADDVQNRDAIDEKIEKCMFGVFERLKEVESENLKLRERL